MDQLSDITEPSPDHDLESTAADLIGEAVAYQDIPGTPLRILAQPEYNRTNTQPIAITVAAADDGDSDSTAGFHTVTLTVHHAPSALSPGTVSGSGGLLGHIPPDPDDLTATHIADCVARVLHNISRTTDDGFARTDFTATADGDSVVIALGIDLAGRSFRITIDTTEPPQ